MRILEIGPSPIRSKGGMATVIGEIQNDSKLNEQFDIEIFESYIDGKNKLISVLFFVFAFIKFFFCKRNYDVYHIHMASYTSVIRKGLYARVAKSWGKKVIIHIHGSEFMKFYEESNDKQSIIDLLKSVDMVIALSENLKNTFDQTFGLTNCVALENGIDIERLLTAITPPELHQHAFLALGRLGKRKGTYDLVEAIKLARVSCPDIMCYLAGDGDVDKIRSIVESEGLSENITVVGWINYDQKIEYLKKVSTVVLPSYNEGLPMAILEGMACGKAIISSTVGAIPEVVKEENGIIIKPGDIEALSNALLKCCDDIDMIKGMSEENKNKIEKQYSMTAMHTRLAEYFNTVYDFKPDSFSSKFGIHRTDFLYIGMVIGVLYSLIGFLQWTNSYLVMGLQALCVICFIIKITATHYKPSMLIVTGIIGLIALYSSTLSGSYFVFVNVLLLLALKDSNIERIVKITHVVKAIILWACLGLFLILFIFSRGMLVTVNVHGIVRYGLMLSHPNNAAMFWLWYILEYLYLNFNKMNVKKYGFLILISVVVYFFTRSDIFIALVLFGICLVLLQARSVVKRIVALFSQFGMLLGTVGFVTLIFMSKTWIYKVIDSVITGRLSLNTKAYMNFGFSLIGQQFESVHHYNLDGLDLGYMVLDNFYIRMMVHYGALFMFFIIVACILYCKHLDYRKQACISLLVLFGVAEHYAGNALISFPMVFVLYAVANYATFRKKDKETEKKDG